MINQQKINEVCSSMIGIPYSELDCWAVVVKFYKEAMDTELKRYYEKVPRDRSTAKNLIYTHKSEFYQVHTPEVGDIITIRLAGVESHIAVYLGEEKILHTSIATGCIIDRLSKWQKCIEGIYRVKND
jgi:cell wall-associated NlpC family hydrolase